MNLMGQSKNKVETGKSTRLKKWVLIPLASIVGIVAVAAIGAYVYQGQRNARVAESLILPGQMIAMGETSLYVNCQGNRGNPTIIFENGMGLASENWNWVQKGLTDDFFTCAYDRAGIGFSKAVTEPVDAGHSADTLARLLDDMNVTGPVLVVGHSYGALIARVFADRFPNRTAGLVLVDSSHEDMAERFPPEERKGFDDMLNGFAILQKANHFGGARLMGVPKMFGDGLEGEAKMRADHLYESVSHMAGSAGEADGWSRSAQLARDVAGRGLGNLPLGVIMVDGWPDTMMPSWTAMQHELSSLSSSGKVTVIEGADHFGVLTQPDHAKRVTQIVRKVAEQAFNQEH